MPSGVRPVVSAASQFTFWIVAMLLLALGSWPTPLRAQSLPAQALPDFTELVDRVGPAVVNIRTLERVRQGSGPGIEIDPNVEEFFRRFGIPLPGRPDPRRGPRGGDEEPQQRGVGSGFILSADGYVMTNAHVVEGADEVLVTLPDKREFKARTVGSDRRTDIAVVKVEASGLPFVKIGDSDKLRVGEWVLAIAWTTPSPPASSAPRGATPATTCRSSRPTWRSTPATRAARCST